MLRELRGLLDEMKDVGRGYFVSMFTVSPYHWIPEITTLCWGIVSQANIFQDKFLRHEKYSWVKTFYRSKVEKIVSLNLFISYSPLFQLDYGAFSIFV